MKAIEVTGTVDAEGQLSLDRPLAVNSQTRVRVIVLFSETTDEADEDILKPAVESFRQGWKEAMTGQRLPISQLWEGIDAD